MPDWISEVLDFVRVVLAGLIVVFVGFLGAGVIIMSLFEWNRWLLILAIPLAAVWGIGSLLGTIILFNWDPFEKKRWAAEAVRYREEVHQAEEHGLIASTDFHARRLFEVDPVEPDFGPYYFFELESGEVLFLNGQYMWEYFGDPDAGEPQRFPCTEFTMRRHQEKGYVIDMDCRGTLLEPEVETPPFDASFYDDEQPFNDGDIITGLTYDQLKQKLLHNSRELREWLDDVEAQITPATSLTST